MGKSLPPYARKFLPGYYTGWVLDWGTRLPHRHHHSTRKHPGAFKPIRRWKNRPRGAGPSLFTRLKMHFRKWRNRLRNK
jgi:hypothetical protein